MSKIDKLYRFVKSILPSPVKIHVNVDGEIKTMRVTEAHRLLHKGVIKYDDIDAKIICGNSNKDVDCFLHIIGCHQPGIEVKPDEGGGLLKRYTKEFHRYLLSKDGEYDDE